MTAGATRGEAERAAAAESALHALLDALPAAELSAIARAFAREAHQAGLYVHRSADGTNVPIPVALSPVVLPRAALAAMSRATRAVAGALVALTGHLLAGSAQPALPDPRSRPQPMFDRLFGAFTPLERECLTRAWPATARLATLRMDFLLDAGGRPRALELNATIPAMQAYSDLAAGTAVRTLGALRGLPPERAASLARRAARNTPDLLASLVALAGGPERARSIAILSRRGDAQLGELRHYEREWTAAGHRALHATADEVRLAEDGSARVRGERFDVLYRHVFARRIDPASDLARVCLEPERHRLFNPVCGQLEAKGMLALLAELADDEGRARAAGISEEAIALVRRYVPWTRWLQAGPATLPDRTRAGDLVPWVRAHRDRLVLKKSWDYGGHGVFLGRDCGPGGASLPRIASLVGRPEASWDDLVDHALRDGDLWIVQELVEATTRRLLLARADAEPVWSELFVDVSAFANLGTGEAGPEGGAVRAAPGRIVNIQGGGGLAPLLTGDVACALAGLDPTPPAGP